MPSLNSTNLSSCEYDADSKGLTITFTSGAEYLYRSVPEEVYEKLLSSPSPGSYFAHSIKNNYQYERLS